MCRDHTECTVEFRNLGGITECDLALLAGGVNASTGAVVSEAEADEAWEYGAADGVLTGQAFNISELPDGVDDGIVWVVRQWSYTVHLPDGLAQGPQTFWFRARDRAGLVGPTVAQSWTVDTVPPRTPDLLATPPKATRDSTATFSFQLLGEAGGACLCDAGA